MRKLAEFVKYSTGWRRNFVALAAGAASTLAMAPIFATPILFVTLPVLVWLLDASCEARSSSSAHPRWRSSPFVRAAFIGWCFGFGYFLTGLYWTGVAFLVEAKKFAILIPFAVMGLPAYLALYWAAAAALAIWIWRPGPARILVLALALSAGEWLRGHCLTGFPWDLLGYSLTWPLVLMQSAGLLGVYGLTLLAVIVFAAPAVLWVDGTASKPGTWKQWRGVLVAVGLVTALCLWGVYRLAAADPPPVPSVHVRLVQPSVTQRDKWRPENQARILAEHVRLSRQPRTGPADAAVGVSLIVWPEAAMPFLVLNTPGALSAIGRMLPANTYLASGTLRYEPAPAGKPGRVFNSLIVFGEGAKPVAQYDKIHLVPFGEYLPLRHYLEAIGLQQLAHVHGSFDSGIIPRPLLRIPGLPPADPLICYEAIFPDEIAQDSERPAFLLNVTNDGWFGRTSGPYQHLHQARVRAVEQGVPLMRAANNGVSAVLDARGRVLQSLGLDVKGVIDAALPGAVNPPPYARWGDWIFVTILGIGAIWLAVAARRPPHADRV